MNRHTTYTHILPPHPPCLKDSTICTHVFTLTLPCLFKPQWGEINGCLIQPHRAMIQSFTLHDRMWQTTCSICQLSDNFVLLYGCWDLLFNFYFGVFLFWNMTQFCTWEKKQLISQQNCPNLHLPSQTMKQEGRPQYKMVFLGIKQKRKAKTKQ